MSSKPRILVLDDDVEMRGLIQRYLTENQLSVQAVADAQALNRALSRDSYDLLVLDLMMPGEDGLSVCRRVRESHPNLGIIMLTARGDPVDKVIGLEMGADDYLSKPFMPRELLARISSVLRRHDQGGRVRLTDETFRFGDFTFDIATMSLSCDKIAIELSTREFLLLKTLIAHRGRPLSRAQIIDLAMGRDAEVTDRSVDVQIVRLRKKLGEDPVHPRYIKTIWGHGYVFTAEEVDDHAAP